MSAGETKPATAIGALKGPSHMLWFTCCHTLAHGWVTTVGAVTALHGLLGGHIRKNGCHPFHIRRKAHVKIPLIICLKRLYSIGNGVLGQILEFGDPMRVN